MRRLLALWLALVPVQPALAAMAPPPPSPAARCTSHGCCARPRGTQPPAKARACHGSSAGFIVAACTHDPVMAAPAGLAPHLASGSPRVFGLAADDAVPGLAPRSVPDAFP